MNKSFIATTVVCSLSAVTLVAGTAYGLVQNSSEAPKYEASEVTLVSPEVSSTQQLEVPVSTVETVAPPARDTYTVTPAPEMPSESPQVPSSEAKQGQGGNTWKPCTATSPANYKDGSWQCDLNDAYGYMDAIPTAGAYNASAYSGVDGQMRYAHEYWHTQGASNYIYLPDVNCANFTSQTLRARGWQYDSSWYYNGANDYSRSWISSTALRNYLASSGRASELSDSQRNQVKVGDIAQFDWDNSGDRDHTAVVSKVEQLSNGEIKIYVIQHTDHEEYRDVDYSIHTVHPGASVYYWSIP